MQTSRKHGEPLHFFQKCKVCSRKNGTKTNSIIYIYTFVSHFYLTLSSLPKCCFPWSWWTLSVHQVVPWYLMKTRHWMVLLWNIQEIQCSFEGSPLMFPVLLETKTSQELISLSLSKPCYRQCDYKFHACAAEDAAGWITCLSITFFELHFS